MTADAPSPPAIGPSLEELIMKWRDYAEATPYRDRAKLYDACADELAAVLRSSSVPQWHPISTAPKDGTTVLLWWRAGVGRDVIEYWACGNWREFGDGSRGWVGESFYSSEPNTWTRLIGERPTHWQPLTKPLVAASSLHGPAKE